MRHFCLCVCTGLTIHVSCKLHSVYLTNPAVRVLLCNIRVEIFRLFQFVTLE